VDRYSLDGEKNKGSINLYAGADQVGRGAKAFLGRMVEVREKQVTAAL